MPVFPVFSESKGGLSAVLLRNEARGENVFQGGFCVNLAVLVVGKAWGYGAIRWLRASACSNKFSVTAVAISGRRKSSNDLYRFSGPTLVAFHKASSQRMRGFGEVKHS